MSQKAHKRKRQNALAAEKNAAANHTVQLCNPVAEHYETWIVGNSVAWQVRAMVELEDFMTPDDYAELCAEFDRFRPSVAFGESRMFHDTVEPFARDRYMVVEGSAAGQHLVLCGAGPSLAEHAAEWCPQGDQVWGCNSAVTWLAEHGHRVTHGFTVDQTPQMCTEWFNAPDVEYLVASTVHPHLTDLLTAKSRPWRLFHNFVGIRKPPVAWDDASGQKTIMAYEDWLYALLYPTCVRAGSGLSSVTRALDVAAYMGFGRITVLGADCSIRVQGEPRHDLTFNSPEHLAWLREHTTMHANGGHALASEASPLTFGGVIDGRYWMTKADLVISARWLVHMARASQGKITLIGDTLPNALIDKPNAFLDRLPNFVDAQGRVANIPV